MFYIFTFLILPINSNWKHLNQGSKSGQQNARVIVLYVIMQPWCLGKVNACYTPPKTIFCALFFISSSRACEQICFILPCNELGENFFFLLVIIIFLLTIYFLSIFHIFSQFFLYFYNIFSTVELFFSPRFHPL